MKVQFSTKKHKAYKDIEKCISFKWKIDQWNVPEKNLMTDPDENFKTTILKMLNELKENTWKLRKLCISKMEKAVKRRNLKQRNCRDEKHNN